MPCTQSQQSELKSHVRHDCLAVCRGLREYLQTRSDLSSYTRPLTRRGARTSLKAALDEGREPASTHNYALLCPQSTLLLTRPIDALPSEVAEAEPAKYATWQATARLGSQPAVLGNPTTQFRTHVIHARCRNHQPGGLRLSCCSALVHSSGANAHHRVSRSSRPHPGRAQN